MQQAVGTVGAISRRELLCRRLDIGRNAYSLQRHLAFMPHRCWSRCKLIAALKSKWPHCRLRPRRRGRYLCDTVFAPGSGNGDFASSFWNLPGDVAAWGASNSAFNATAGSTGTSGTCGTTTGEISGVRAVTAGQCGNVYILDGTNDRARVIVGPPAFTLPSGTVLTNCLPSAINLYPARSSVTAAQLYGRIYPIEGGFPASIAGSPCASSTGTAADNYGDGCAWYKTSQTNANPVGVTIDSTVEGGSPSPHRILLGCLGGRNQRCCSGLRDHTESRSDWRLPWPASPLRLRPGTSHGKPSAI